MKLLKCLEQSKRKDQQNDRHNVRAPEILRSNDNYDDNRPPRIRNITDWPQFAPKITVSSQIDARIC